MAFDNNGRGVLFPNDRKQSDKHPDYKGELTIDNVTYEIGAWQKTSQKGASYLSLSVKPKRQEGF